MNLEIKSPNTQLGNVLATYKNGKKTVIVREYGTEQFTPALDPRRHRLEVIAQHPRKIINLMQLKYRMKRRNNNVDRTIFDARANTTNK